MQPALRYSGNLSNSNGDAHKPWPAQRELSWLGVMLRVPDGGRKIGQCHTFRAKSENVRMSMSASQNDGIE